MDQFRTLQAKGKEQIQQGQEASSARAAKVLEVQAYINSPNFSSPIST
jgi:hypothetical protein